MEIPSVFFPSSCASELYWVKMKSVGVRAQFVGGDFSSLVGMSFLRSRDAQRLEPDPTGNNLSVGATKILPSPTRPVLFTQ